MAQYSTAVRNAQLDVVETTIGTSPIMTLRSGAPPANCAAANSGTVGATITLPADWMAAASGGTKAKSGTWQDASADNAALIQHYRIHDSTATTCHEQGLVAEPWTASKAYILNQQVSNDGGKCYRATAAGTSAGSGGPTGTGASITDGGVTWQYVGLVDLTLDNTNVNAAQAVTINTYTKTAGNP